VNRSDPSVGDIVLYFSTRDDFERGKSYGGEREVRTGPTMIGERQVCWVTGIRGCVAVSSLKLVTPVEDRDDFTGIDEEEQAPLQAEFGF